ncbi:MAG: IclR family transcriptional regulator [Kiritimatiellae bacterium]|nr:IclR family transcriptional regulator [Kiritimatiellia bacterium]
MSGETTTPPIQSLDRGLALLEAVGGAGRSVSLPELTRVLGIDRSSVFRLANTLRRRGFLAHPGGSRDYVLGSAIVRLGAALPWRSTLVQIAGPPLRRLAEETGETAHLAIRDGGRALFIGHHRTSQPVGVDGRSGYDELLHCTAIGKALLADFDRSQLVALLGAGPLATPTSHSIASIDTLAKECERTRRLGYASDDQETHEGVRCIGAPVRDASGSIVASIGISAPVHRFPMRRFKDVGPVVLRAALAVGAELGFDAGG